MTDHSLHKLSCVSTIVMAGNGMTSPEGFWIDEGRSCTISSWNRDSSALYESRVAGLASLTRPGPGGLRSPRCKHNILRTDVPTSVCSAARSAAQKPRPCKYWQIVFDTKPVPPQPSILRHSSVASARLGAKGTAKIGSSETTREAHSGDSYWGKPQEGPRRARPLLEEAPGGHPCLPDPYWGSLRRAPGLLDPYWGNPQEVPDPYWRKPQEDTLACQTLFGGSLWKAPGFPDPNP
jgi:hypothetical protein